MSETTPVDLKLGDIIADMRRYGWVVVILAAVIAVLGFVWGTYRDKWYEANVVVSVVGQGSGGTGGGLAQLAGQYSGLAALAGISISGADRSSETVAVLKSELLTSSYIKEQGLLPILFPKGPTKKQQAENNASEAMKAKEPTVWDGNAYFARSIRQVAMDAKTGLVTMTIRWKDPVVAAKWANDLVERTNDYLRGQAIAEAERNIQYLTDQAKGTTVVEASYAINSLMEQEINKAMLARGRLEFALHVIDPAVPPGRSSGIGRTLLGVMWGFGGLFLGVCFLLGRRVVLSGIGSA